MKSFNDLWEKIHASREWGKYPCEEVVRFIARNYYDKERSSIKICDFGCGGGAHTWYLAREGFDVYGFDGSESAVKLAKKRLAADGLHAKLEVNDALNLTYPKECFDCVLDSAVIFCSRYENIAKMYSYIHSILKDGGKLFSTAFSADTTGYKIGKELEHNTYDSGEEFSSIGPGIKHVYTIKEAEETLKTAGFTNIIIDTITFTDKGHTLVKLIMQAERQAS